MPAVLSPEQLCWEFVVVSVKPHLQPCPQEETQIDMFNVCLVVHHQILKWKLGVGAHHTLDTPYSGKYTPISHGAHFTYMHVCPSSLCYINLLLCVNILDHVLSCHLISSIAYSFTKEVIVQVFL